MAKNLSTMITPDHAAKLLSDLSYGEGSTTMEKSSTLVSKWQVEKVRP